MYSFRAYKRSNRQTDRQTFEYYYIDTQKNKIIKAINKNTGIDINLSKTQLQKLKKHGGFLPFLPLILGGLSAIGSLVAGFSQKAKAVNQAKTNERQLQETK